MGLKTPKNLLLPKVDNVKDPEVKRIFQQLINAIQKMNQTTCGDLTGLEERITAHGI